MIDQLKDLKDTYEIVRNAIDHCREPKHELILLKDCLSAIAQDFSLINEKADKDYKRYFQEDFTQGLLKKLVRERSNDEKYLEIIGQILDQYMYIFLAYLKAGTLTLAFLDGVKLIFESDTFLYSQYFQISESQLNAIRLAGQHWRNELRTGDMIDAVQDEMSRCSGWEPARVEQVTGDVLQVGFIYDNKSCDKYMDKYSSEVAQHLTKTKVLVEWKTTLKVGDQIDAYDKNSWNKSTILEIKEQQVGMDRSIQVAYVAYRIYFERGTKLDEKGNFEGYSNRYDEWIPLYSPRIQQFYTKTQRTFQDEVDIDDDIDTLYPAEQGHSRVYAVPRLRKCTSKLYIHMINEFGHLGGFDMIIQAIQKATDQNDIDLNTIGSLIELVSKPYLVYHKDFSNTYCQEIVKLAQKAIKQAADKSLRDINKDRVDNVIRSIDNLLKRQMNKEERERETEILKLEICLLCLKSSLLDKRIQGIKDLNQVIRNNRIFSSKSISNQYLIQWMKENDVFSVIFDVKKTHLQIVQRSNDILKLLLQEDQLDQSLFDKFWNLSKSDYKVEIYKILNDIAFYLKDIHYHFIQQQLLQTNFDKISIDDYTCLQDLTKHAKSESFKENVNHFFWDIIIKSDQTKNSQQIVTGMNFIRINKIQIYKRPFTNYQEDDNNKKDEEEEERTPIQIEREVIEAIISNLEVYCNQANQKIEQNPNLIQESRKKLYLVNQKYSHHEEIDERLQFIKYLASFSYSFRITKVELSQIYSLLVLKSKIPSDEEELLVWCKQLCENSGASGKSALDLNEVGEFFTEKMKSRELDLRTLPIVGLEFLQHYFLSVNEKEQKVFKSNKSQKQSKFVSSFNFQQNGYYPNVYNNKQKDQDEDKGPIFKLICPPEELEQLDIVWQIALQSENPRVIPKAINFLIRCHYQLDEDLDSQKIEIQDKLIEKCMSFIKESSDEFTLNRVIEIIKNVIYEAEKKGTGDVQPHNAVLKGELLERIQVRYRAHSKSNNIQFSIYSNTTVWEFKKEIAKQLELAPKYLKLERFNGQVLKDLDNGKTLAEIGIQAHENLSAYKIQVEEEIANAPLIGQDGKLTDKLRSIFEEWYQLYSDPSTGFMTKESTSGFIKGCTGEFPGPSDERISGLFAQYDSNKDGVLELSEFLKFYETAARNKPDTVRENLKAHNIRADLKKLSEVQEESSYKTQDMPRYKISVQQEYFDLLMSLLDRSDSVSQTSWDLIQMLATNQILYRRVLELQNVIDQKTQKIDWTKFFDSQSDYKLLYTLQIIEAVMEEGEGSNLERITVIKEQPQLKKIPAAPVPPPGTDQITQNGDIPPADEIISTPAAAQPIQTQQIQEEEKQPKPLLMKKNTAIIEDEEINQKLKSQWTQMFLSNGGIQYIMQVFMDKEIKDDINQGTKSFNQAFELKHIAFLLKLLRIFIMAAFSTNKESSIYQAINIIRKSSTFQEEDFNKQVKEEDPAEGSRFKELQILLKGPLGQEIIDQIDYKQLQQKILQIIAQILQKKEMIFEDKLIIENALSLWVGCVLHHNVLFEEFKNFKTNNIQKSEDLVLAGLLYCPYEKVREEFKSSLSLISQKLSPKLQEQSPLKYLLHLLSENFTQISNYHSKQYFELFCSLIELHFFQQSLSGLASSSVDFNAESLLSQTIDKIKEYHSIVQELSSQEEDKDESTQDFSELESLYIGLIQLSEKIIDNFDISLSERIVQEKGLMEELFVKFLFSALFQNGQKTKEIKIQPKKARQNNKKQILGKKAKDAAYKLVNSLIKRSPLLMHNFLDKCMLPLMKQIKRPEGWNYSPQGQNNNSSSNNNGAMAMEKSQKYVGLRNLGCICYMNSMLQQFFMIPAFRYNLLCVDDLVAPLMKDYKGKTMDDNVLHQLQKLMAHLELSERGEYNPFEFCFSFKDLDGNPTNTGEQKDAQEFLNLSFERIENLLKPTSRKYLLQSVFGGQTCSQLVCQECGNVKNRIEDFYNLSLTVKDIKSMHESLQKLVDGEVINDYQCEGCNKKVDVSKRTLISSTPNVLIVHLQRIVFNFDSFKNDKLNTYFEFPYQLDLKPYSFFDVMTREGRVKSAKGDDEEEEIIKPEEVKTDDDQKWPEEEDCFEYKLVGATVHSGTAESGHYWSYINTQRGYLEPEESDPNWNKTEGEPWMEFNDSRVSEFNFEKMRDECFGDQAKATGSGGYDNFSSWGSYGKSAYMLVYERKKKRPIAIVLTKEEEIADAKARNENIIYNEEKKEHIKLISYREGVEDIAPNQIYKQVHEDNQKYEFDNDVFSTEFFDFLKSILGAANQLLTHFEWNEKADKEQEMMKEVQGKVMELGKKSVLEILSKCYNNQGLLPIIDSMIQTLKHNPELSYQFLSQCYKEDNFDYLLQVMLECPDLSTRQAIATLVKHILSSLREQEKEILYETEIEEKTYLDESKQSSMKIEIEVPKAMSAKFIQKCIESLNQVIAKNWSRFDCLLEVLYEFGVGEINNTAETTQEQKDRNELIGLEYYFKQGFIGKACDFLLGKKSPLSSPNDRRYEMGGSYAYSAPNFGAINRLITRMINNEQLLQKYPLSDLERKLLLQHDFLKVMLTQSATSGSKQFGKSLANICEGNLKHSKKVSKIFIKLINSSTYDNVRGYLKALKPFLQLQDDYKQLRLEWIFGVSQIVNRKEYRESKYKFGLELIQKIGDDAYNYNSPLHIGPNEDALLNQLLKCRGRMDTFAINCLKEMISLMLKDDFICRYIYHMQPSAYQYARYTDWMKPYLESQKQELEKNNSYSYMKQKYDTCVRSLQLITKLEQTKWKALEEEDRANYELLKESCPEFQQISEDWQAFANEDVIKHFPPELVIGKQTAERVIQQLDSNNGLVQITISEVENEYNYSNPTGYFNTSLPHIELKTSTYQTMSYQYFKKMIFNDGLQAKRHQKLMQQQEENEKNGEDQVISDPQEEIKEPEAEIYKDSPVRDWFQTRKEGVVFLKVTVTNKTKETVKFSMTIKNSDPQTGNVQLPQSQLGDTLYQSESKIVGFFQKINPIKPWTQIEIDIESLQKMYGAAQGQNQNSNATGVAASSQFKINVYDTNGNVQQSGVDMVKPMKTVSCLNCHQENPFTNTQCDNCKTFMLDGVTYDPQDTTNNKSSIYEGY